MTPEQLKASILQMAIQGKLVEQRAEEGTAEELYQKIQKKKQKLIKEGKIKKEKPLPEITDEEVPFDIPESWKWVRVKNVCTKIVDGDHNPPAGHNQPTDYLMLSATNINFDKLVDLDKVRYVTREIFEVENQRTKVKVDDIFFTIVGSMGRSCVYKGGLNICFQRSVSVITTLLYPEYLKYILDTPYIQNYMYINSTGTAQKGFYLKQVENLVIPIPPLEEQHRIVAKIEELLPYVDRYAEAYEKLEQFNARFPEDMKKSILQYAIQGKLVEQRPEEGTAEELYQKIQKEKQKLIKEGKIKKENPLPEITDDEIPFDIPESWKWVRIQDLFFAHSAMRIHQSDWKSEGIPFFRGRELVRLAKTGDPKAEIFITEDFYNELKSKGGVPKKNDILISAVGTLGKVYVVRGTKKFYYKDAYILCLDNYGIAPYFVKYYIESPFIQNYIYGGDAYGTTVAQLTLEKLKKMLIPIPPLEEQHRIVAKIEELLPYFNRLIKD